MPSTTPTCELPFIRANVVRRYANNKKKHQCAAHNGIYLLQYHNAYYRLSLQMWCITQRRCTKQNQKPQHVEDIGNHHPEHCHLNDYLPRFHPEDEITARILQWKIPALALCPESPPSNPYVVRRRTNTGCLYHSLYSTGIYQHYYCQVHSLPIQKTWCNNLAPKSHEKPEILVYRPYMKRPTLTPPDEPPPIKLYTVLRRYPK